MGLFVRPHNHITLRDHQDSLLSLVALREIHLMSVYTRAMAYFAPDRGWIAALVGLNAILGRTSRS